jgi:elongin-A
LIQRDIPNWKTKNYIPKNPTKWYEIYCKYKKEQRKELERDEEILKASLAEINKKKATNVSKIVELRKLPKLPRDPRMMANNGGVPLGRSRETGRIGPNASSLSWTSGSKTKLTDGKSVLTRARREAKEISQRGKLAKPTHALLGRAGQIKQAPAGMVNEYRRDRMPAHVPPVKILSKKREGSGQFEGGMGGPSLEEREKRLRALTMSRGNAPGAAEATLVGSSDDEEASDDDLDELFDEKPNPPRRQMATARSAVSSQSSPVPSASSRSSTIRSESTMRSQPRQALSSSPSSASSSRPISTARPKPSDLISAIVSKPKPKPTQRALTPQRSSTPTAFSRSPSPSHGERSRMVVKRRPPPDIFNRAPTKKPRAR